MSACIPTYMLASSLIGGGMNWSQAVLTIFLGNLIVLLPMVLNAHAGTKYGIPFPVFCRASVRHARRKRPRAVARAGGVRMVRHPDVDRRQRHLQNPRRVLPRARPGRAAAGAGHHGGAVGVLPVLLGRSTCGSSTAASIPSACCSRSRRRCSSSSGWRCSAGRTTRRADSGRCSRSPRRSTRASRRRAGSGNSSCPALTGMISFWATLSLNIPDFSRYARSAARPDRRASARAAADDGVLFVHRRGGHQRDDHHLRRNALGPGGRAHAF